MSASRLSHIGESDQSQSLCLTLRLTVCGSLSLWLIVCTSLSLWLIVCGSLSLWLIVCGSLCVAHCVWLIVCRPTLNRSLNCELIHSASHSLPHLVILARFSACHHLGLAVHHGISCDHQHTTPHTSNITSTLHLTLTDTLHLNTTREPSPFLRRPPAKGPTMTKDHHGSETRQ